MYGGKKSLLSCGDNEKLAVFSACIPYMLDGI